MDIGVFSFGLVIGWVTYRTLRRKEKAAITDLTAVISAVGGATVTSIFQKAMFSDYCLGLAVGFFGYLIIAMIFNKTKKDKTSDDIDEWMGKVG